MKKKKKKIVTNDEPIVQKTSINSENEVSVPVIKEKSTVIPIEPVVTEIVKPKSTKVIYEKLDIISTKLNKDTDKSILQNFEPKNLLVENHEVSDNTNFALPVSDNMLLNKETEEIQSSDSCNIILKEQNTPPKCENSLKEFEICEKPAIIKKIKKPITKAKNNRPNKPALANVSNNITNCNPNITSPNKYIKIKHSEVENTEKKKFLERKCEFKKKIGNLIDGNFERSKITMFDLIYWNPPGNPMPGQKKDIKKKQRKLTISNTETEELLVEEENLDITNKNTTNETEKDNKPIENTESICESNNNTDEEAERTGGVLVPKVKIGPNGSLIIDETSLVVQTTAAKNRNKILKTTEVIEETGDSSHYGKWSKRRKRAPEWTKKETARFYKALSTVGTDFSLMSTVFAWRTRAELKVKFKKEERIHKDLIDIALNDCTQFDFSIFEESEYDPVADRKETKEHEKNETRRKKEEERLKRQEERLEEKRKKQEQKIIDKDRKRKLKEDYRNSKKKTKKSKDTFLPMKNFVEESNESTATSVIIEAQEVVCEVILSNTNMRKRVLDFSEGFVTPHNQDTPIISNEDSFIVTEENSIVTNADEMSDDCQETTQILNTSESFVDLTAATEGSVNFLSVSLIQKTDDGASYINVKNSKGMQSVPVPPLLSSTTHLMVMPSLDPEDPMEKIYHVYIATPISNTTATTSNNPEENVEPLENLPVDSDPVNTNDDLNSSNTSNLSSVIFPNKNLDETTNSNIETVNVDVAQVEDILSMEDNSVSRRNTNSVTGTS